MQRIVLHIDMDAFFASVEERDKPRLKGKPIVVGSDPEGGKGRGVVSTANYAARAYGIKSAMPISRAWEKSQQAKRGGKPEVVFMEPDFKAYQKASEAIFTYIATQGNVFEQTSIDEGYLELTNSSWRRGQEVAEKIKEWIKKEQGLTCSIGIGPNKLISKIAAGKDKPEGLTLITGSQVEEFLNPLSVRELPGVGPKTETALNKLGIFTISELKKKTLEFLVEEFGKHGQSLYRGARGVDNSPLEAEHEQKSIGEQMTFDRDTLDPAIIVAAFEGIVNAVARKIKKENKKFKTIAIVVRFSDFETFTRSHSLKEASDNGEILKTEAFILLLPFLDSRENPKRKKIRLVGVRAERLFERGLF